MSLAASLNVGVSSLRAYAQGIQTVSNNIANVNTVGYKSSHAQYSDTFANLLRPLVPNENNTAVKIAPTQIGGGVQVQSVSPVFSQGTIQVTSSTSDLAIAGAGFFRVKNPSSNQPFVTRAGNFRVDADGMLVTQLGYNVQGAVGAQTKVIYDSLTGAYDVKGPQDNPVVTVPSGMIEIVAGDSLSTPPDLVTTKEGERDVIMSVEQAAKLSEGMTIKSSVKGSIPAGSQILSIVRELDGSGKTVARVTLSRPAFRNASDESFSAGGLTVSSRTNEILFPPNPDRPALSEGTPITGPGLPPGTVIQYARGNFVSGVTAAPPPVSLASAVATIDAGDRTVLTIDAGVLTGDQVNSLTGMYVSKDDNIDDGTTIVSAVQDADGKVTLTLSGTGVKGTLASLSGLSFSAGKTLDKTKDYITVTDISGIEVGMTVVGSGIPSNPELGSVVVAEPPTLENGVYQVKLKYAKSGGSVQLTTDSYSATKFAFGDQRVFLNKLPLVDSYETVNFSLATEFSRANVIGNVRVGFDYGKDFEFYGTDGNKLSGITLEAAKLGAPKIRTFNIGSDGGINVVLSNGQTFQSGMVLLQSFKDPGALIREGDNMFSGIETAGPYNGPWNNDNIMNLIPSTKGLGAINGGSLELSNVDLGEEFSSMIITQRAFQAGSRVISTADQMLEEAVNLKR
jgi:flagellar hook protein FlgE